MKRKHQLNILCFIVMFIIVSETKLQENYYPNIDANSYLSSKDEKRSVAYCNGNDSKSDFNSKKIEFEDFNGKWSLMQFVSKKDNKINIIDNTKINKGKFYIVILDRDNNIITKKDELTETGDIIFTTPKEDKYTIRIVGINASGQFDISVNASDNVIISRMDFFNNDFSNRG